MNILFSIPSEQFYRRNLIYINKLMIFSFYCQALNDVCECQGWCIEVIGGRIGSIKVNVPWNALMSEDSSIEVTGLFINIKPLARQKDGTSMLESMWSSMSSSMQLAQDCLEKEGSGLSAAKKMEGLECFAQTIDNGIVFLNKSTSVVKRYFYFFLSSLE